MPAADFKPPFHESDKTRTVALNLQIMTINKITVCSYAGRQFALQINVNTPNKRLDQNKVVCEVVIHKVAAMLATKQLLAQTWDLGKGVSLGSKGIRILDDKQILVKHESDTNSTLKDHLELMEYLRSQYISTSTKQATKKISPLTQDQAQKPKAQSTDKKQQAGSSNSPSESPTGTPRGKSLEDDFDSSGDDETEGSGEKGGDVEVEIVPVEARQSPRVPHLDLSKSSKSLKLPEPSQPASVKMPEPAAAPTQAPARAPVAPAAPAAPKTPAAPNAPVAPTPTAACPSAKAAAKNNKAIPQKPASPSTPGAPPKAKVDLKTPLNKRQPVDIRATENPYSTSNSKSGWAKAILDLGGRVVIEGLRWESKKLNRVLSKPPLPEKK